MKVLIGFIFVVSFFLGVPALADHHKGEMAEMGSEHHMKMSTQFEKMAAAHKSLGECLKTNKAEPKKCKDQRGALKTLRMAKKQMHKDWKGKKKGMKKKHSY